MNVNRQHTINNKKCNYKLVIDLHLPLDTLVVKCPNNKTGHIHLKKITIIVIINNNKIFNIDQINCMLQKIHYIFFVSMLKFLQTCLLSVYFSSKPVVPENNR